MPSINLVERLSDNLPLWAIGLVLLFACIGTLETGEWFGRRHNARHSAEKAALQGPGARQFIVSSVFSLLALLLSITFAISLDRFDSRSDLAAEEATAIRTAYLRADLLNEPHRTRVRSTLREYARVRVVPEHASRESLITLQAHNERLRDRLWRETNAAALPVREPWMAAAFAHAMTDALGVGTRRSLAARVPMPAQIIDMLILYLVVAMGVVGYLLGLEGSDRRYASHLLIVLFVLAFLLIIDIDRPRSGPIRVPTLALDELIAEVGADGRAEQNPNSGQ